MQTQYVWFLRKRSLGLSSVKRATFCIFECASTRQTRNVKEYEEYTSSIYHPPPGMV